MSDIKLKALFPDICLITNPEVIKVRSIKQKHFDRLPYRSFHVDELSGKKEVQPFDILGATPITGKVVIREANTEHLFTTSYEELFNFYCKRKGIDTNSPDADKFYWELKVGIPQLIVD